MLGFKIINEGERAVLWNPGGRRTAVDGPRIVFAPFKNAAILERFTATPGEYIVVDFKDGRSEHRKGPATEWFDPVIHEEIRVHTSLEIDANEAVVVYCDDNGEVTRRIVRGPALFMPDAHEWMHIFRWHGADPKKTDRKKPGALQFCKLRVIPDQMYFDVEEVRTTDEALLTVKLMIFFELKDIDLMLDRTHDPIADFINALTADIISFVGTKTFEAFKEHTEQLNDMEVYKQLVQRAASIGYHIGKVVYRGYHANAKLQEMHDNAIEVRTGLILEGETERQAQDLEDLKQKRTIDREIEREAQEERAAAHHRRIEELDHKEKIRRQQAEQDQKIAFRKRLNEVELEKEKQRTRGRLDLLAGMKELETDLTKVLVAENRNPDKYVMIGGEKEPALHLHE